jgi:nicotinamide riboside kinase
VSLPAQPLRVYFVGCESSGKTTLARWVAHRYGLPLVTEVARSVLAEMEIKLDVLRADIDLTNDFQSRVFKRQILAEQDQPGAFVSDRAFDNLAYAAQHSTVLSDVIKSVAAREYMRWVSGGIVLFVRPQRELIRDDGVRAGLNWDAVLRIDGMIKLMLEQFEIPYLPLDTPSMQERVRTVEFVMKLAAPALTPRRKAKRNA